jgi:hypothetical protein
MIIFHSEQGHAAVIGIIVGLVCLAVAKVVRGIYWASADQWSRDGVVRRGGLSQKIWREDDPGKFESIINGRRLIGTGSGIFFLAVGAVLVIAGMAQLLSSLL